MISSCALPEELTAMTAMLDHQYTEIDDFVLQDENAYTLGMIGRHNVVVTNLASGTPGKVEAARTVENMMRSFPNIPYGLVLMVGICGGVWSPTLDVRLGDVVVSQPDGVHGGVVQYDSGKMDKDGQFVRTGALSKPPRFVLTALSQLKSNTKLHGSGLPKYVSKMFLKHPNLRDDFRRPGPHEDRLFQWHYKHSTGTTCDQCDISLLVKRPARRDPDAIQVWYGNIASADMVMKHAANRDLVAAREKIIAFEMEGAGLMDTSRALVIRGVCDYADSHKNDEWHNFAAVAAAAYAKELIYALKSLKIPGERVRGLTGIEGSPVGSRRQSFSNDDRTNQQTADRTHQWIGKTQARVQATVQRRAQERPERNPSEYLKRLQKSLFVPDPVDDRAHPSEPVEGTCE